MAVGLIGLSVLAIGLTRLARLSQADFIALVDKDGHLVNTSRTRPTPVTALADRDYFQHFRRGHDHGIFISRLLVNRVSGQPMIFFAKGISGPNDEFLGSETATPASSRPG